MPSSSRPRALDLFSGVGGLSKGLTEAGLDVVGAVEIDEYAAANYTLNNPATRLWISDVREVSASAVKRELGLKTGELAVLAACAPCQGFSRMRTLNGSVPSRDPRNSLVRAILPYVEVLRPSHVLLENVPAARDNRHMGHVRATLRALGYALSEDVVDLADFGLPQHRRRYVLVASRVGEPRFPARSTNHVTVRQTIGALPRSGDSGDRLHDLSWTGSERIRQLVAKIPRDGGSRSYLGKEDWLACHQRTDGFRDVYGRLHWDRPSVTITSGFVNPSKGRFLHPDENRPLTLREASLLQGFNNSFMLDVSKGRYAAAQLIGNAVPPLFAQLQAAALLSL